MLWGVQKAHGKVSFRVPNRFSEPRNEKLRIWSHFIAFLLMIIFTHILSRSIWSSRFSLTREAYHPSWNSSHPNTCSSWTSSQVRKSSAFSQRYCISPNSTLFSFVSDFSGRTTFSTQISDSILLANPLILQQCLQIPTVGSSWQPMC